MNKYYVNTNTQFKTNKVHEVHKEGCSHLPNTSDIEYIGEFNNCLDAVIEASRLYTSVNGCKYCCGPCHHTTL